MKDEFGRQRDGVTIPTFWIAIALSVLLHIALFWKWLPLIHLPSPELDERGQSSGSLSVELAPPRPPRPPSEPAPQSRPTPPPPPRSKPPSAPRPASPPPVLAMRTPPPTPAPKVAVPAPAPVAPPAPATPPPVGDFASNIEARRRARGEFNPPSAAESPPMEASMAEDDKARANRIAAANLATRKQQTFGYDPSQGGGVFQIVRIGYLDAEFLFFGWNKDIRRNTKQLIEVPKGNNADTRIAVVRKMISIIREYEQGDFLWESHRLGRNLTLSARPRDNASLEQFMMLEFFEDPQRPPPYR